MLGRQQKPIKMLALAAGYELHICRRRDTRVGDEIPPMVKHATSDGRLRLRQVHHVPPARREYLKCILLCFNVEAKIALQIHLTDMNNHINALESGKRFDYFKVESTQIERINKREVQPIRVQPTCYRFGCVGRFSEVYFHRRAKLAQTLFRQLKPIRISIGNNHFGEWCSTATAHLPCCHATTINEISVSYFRTPRAGKQIDVGSAGVAWSNEALSYSAGNIDISTKILMFGSCPGTDLLNRITIITRNQITHIPPV